MVSVLSLAGAATSIVFCRDKLVFVCRDKVVFVCRDKTCLSGQNTSFVATKVCLPRQNICRDKMMFVAGLGGGGGRGGGRRLEGVWGQQHRQKNKNERNRTRWETWQENIIGGSCHKYHCRDKHILVETKDVFCRDKHVFVATNTGLRQNFCRDKNDICGSSRQ